MDLCSHIQQYGACSDGSWAPMTLSPRMSAPGLPARANVDDDHAGHVRRERLAATGQEPSQPLGADRNVDGRAARRPGVSPAIVRARHARPAPHDLSHDAARRRTFRRSVAHARHRGTCATMSTPNDALSRGSGGVGKVAPRRRPDNPAQLRWKRPAESGPLRSEGAGRRYAKGVGANGRTRPRRSST